MKPSRYAATVTDAKSLAIGMEAYLAYCIAFEIPSNWSALTNQEQRAWMIAGDCAAEFFLYKKSQFRWDPRGRKYVEK